MRTAALAFQPRTTHTNPGITIHIAKETLGNGELSTSSTGELSNLHIAEET